MNTKLVHQVLQDLQTMRLSLSNAEQEVLVSLTFQAHPPTTRQLAILSQIAERILSPEIAAELRGQLSLFREANMP